MQPIMNTILGFVDRLVKHRWVLHGLFWFSILALYVLFFGRQSSNYQQTLLFVGLLIPVTIGASYFLNYRLIPDYLLKERFGSFILYFIYTILASLYVEMLIVIFIFIALAETKVSKMAPASLDIIFLLASLLLVVFLAGGIKLLKHWRDSRDKYQQLMKEKVESELKFLKAQLNPHFLFNTLNNLYYLASQRSEKTASAILALSEMLDYVLHSGKTIFVPLEDELNQLRNYMALELLRYEGRVTTNLSVTGQPAGCSIAPMVLVTLVENAFKHGVMVNTSKSLITINLDCKPDRMHVSMKNSRLSNTIGNGVGLKNLRNQLNLLYGEQYSLSIDTSADDQFSVSLSLPSTP
jgi:sensor histidine kinase YesM